MKILPLPRLCLLVACQAILLASILVPETRAQAPAAATTSTSEVAPELIAKFIATLTNATLKGRWASTNDDQLGPEKEDSYQIVSVSRNEGDRWTINAKMSYGGKSLVLPIPALVKWAGDTPVLIVDKLGLGIGPMYSARVMIYEGTYAGTWNGGDHGGLLYGQIVPTKN